jgi:NodT family efflux transporter outer membrane factor (OMF) lipoprotein
MKLRILFLAFTLILSGCTKLGPDFLKPDAPVEEQWLEAEETPEEISITTDSTEYAEWWRSFNDPVLDSLISKAYEENLSLQIAGIRILEARAQLGIAVGNVYPQQQQVGGSVSRNFLSDNSVAPGSPTAFNSADVGFGVGWELDLWGKFARGLEAADADVLASITDYDDVLVSLTGSVANAYSIIRTFEEQLQIARKNVEIQKRSVEITGVRFKNGITTELDLQQARTLLLNTQATIPSLETGLQQSKNALSTLLGMPPSNLNDYLQGEGVIPTAPAEVAIGIPAELLRRRPDIRTAELQAASQSARIGIAESELYPHFSLIGTVGLSASDFGGVGLDDMFQSDSVEGSFGPSVSWNIFNYGRIKNNVRVQDARLQQLLVNYQNVVLEAAREVEDALVGFIQAKRRVVYLVESVDAAQRSVDLALIQYRDGVADYQRVLDTQEALLAQEDQLTASKGDIATNLIAMYRALGGGWEIREGNDFVPAEIKQEMKDRTDWGELLESGAAEIPESEKAKRFRKIDW